MNFQVIFLQNISPFSYQCVLQIFLASLESQIGIQREVDVFIRSLQMCKEDLMSSLRLSRQERKTLMHSKGFLVKIELKINYFEI